MIQAFEPMLPLQMRQKVGGLGWVWIGIPGGIARRQTMDDFLLQ